MPTRSLRGRRDPGPSATPCPAGTSRSSRSRNRESTATSRLPGRRWRRTQEALPFASIGSQPTPTPSRRSTSPCCATGSAKYWRRVLLPVIERYRGLDIPKFFRGDAAFAGPKLLRLLEQEAFRYAIRIKANAVLEREIAHLLKRPVGRPSRKPKVFYASVRYQAKSWECARRVVAKVEWHAGELFPRFGFIVTNLKGRSKRVVRFYNRRGTAEQWIKEGKNAVKWTKLSCRRFKDNAARLQLFALAYNLANFLRQLVLPKPIKGWTLTTLQEKLIKIGAKVVRHSKYVIFQLAEVAVPRKLFTRILEGIAHLRPACASG